MDDSCAVCAETLLWVAYGSCGHREVCSTCVIRLRFICDDRRCCLCKSESDIIFVTKALGDYTRVINDFSVFPADPTEGQVGPYWYHQGSQAYFDDIDQYKMIKAMCRLSCIVCDKINEQRKEGSKRRAEFKNIEQLRSHLFHLHRLFMCRLCLEGRKIHFRQEHHLCENEACIAKKFVVFTTESELKRHNAMEHGGHMSRSKRNAALQIQTSFQYRRNEQDREGRGCVSHPNLSDNQLSLAIQASLETTKAEHHHASSSTQAVSNHREASDTESIVNKFEVLATRESETPSRRHCASVQNTRASLEESSFPPLPVASRKSQQKSRNASGGLGGNTMAARLRHRNNGTVTVLHSSQAWPNASRPHPTSSSTSSSLSNLPSSSQRKPVKVNEHSSSIHTSPAQSRLATAHPVTMSNLAGLSRNSGSTSQVGHSLSTPNLVDRRPFEISISSFPPVSASQTNKAPSSSHTLPKVEDAQNANKSLVETIRAALEFDENKFGAFKEISSEYRQGLVDTGEYLAYIFQFGLSHLVLELARLCPDPRKQKELIETYNLNMTGGSYENILRSDGGRSKNKKSSKKGKEKCGENGFNSSKAALEDSIISSVKSLQSNYKPSEDVEVLSKDGYRSGKGKLKISVDDEQTNLISTNQSRMEPKLQNGSHLAGDSSKKNLETGVGGNKPKKKVPKFLRNRLGNDATALLDLGDSDPGPGQTEEKPGGDKEPPGGLPVCGVWQNGGGQRLVAITRRDRRK
uniref:RING-type domain-containing protein n=1 Tax=Fagus sylvatica TaxID=28930 RepID=A0A2N9EWQ1_FAGSY